MRYVTLFLGVVAISLVTLVHFYPDEVNDFIDEHILKKEYVVATANDYYLDNDYDYIQNYTDDVSNKQELLDYIYYVINTGADYADGECKKEYKDCVKDLQQIADDTETLSVISKE